MNNDSDINEKTTWYSTCFPAEKSLTKIIKHSHGPKRKLKKCIRTKKLLSHWHHLHTSLSKRRQVNKQTTVVISAQSSPQISASVPHSRHPPLRWEHCSTHPLPGTVTYTWKTNGRIRKMEDEKQGYTGKSLWICPASLLLFDYSTFPFILTYWAWFSSL